MKGSKRILLPILILIGSSLVISASDNSFSRRSGDTIIPGYEPPAAYYEIREGSCGEACLWSVLKNRNIHVSQKVINRAGGNPGRGLHSGELFRVLKRYGIRYRRIPGRVKNYRRYLEQKILGSLKKGRPLLLGVKILPDLNPRWACDHFILAVGFNMKRGELIYNSFNGRHRIKLAKLLDGKKGYSLVSRHNYVFAIVFPQ